MRDMAGWGALGFAILGMAFAIAKEPDGDAWIAALCGALSIGLAIGWAVLSMGGLP